MTADELKASVLQMAIEGRLVPQRDDEPAVDIDGEELEDVPFAIPNKWKWVRLGLCVEIVSARRVLQKDWRRVGVPFYRAREIGALSDNRKINNELFIDKSLYNKLKEYGIPEEGDLMVTAVGTLGKCYIVTKNDVFYYKDASVLCFKYKKRVLPKYLKYIMESSLMKEQIRMFSSGTTVGTITIKNANQFLISLPPLEEQHRIVERLEEILPVIEQYGKAHDALQAVEKELLGKLRVSLLQEAISGRLVPQRDDEPAVDIDVEEPDDVPFAIPDKWKWVKVRDVGRIASGATPKTGIAEFWSPEEIPWITPADLGKNRAKTIGRGERFISRKGYESCSAVLLPKGTIIYSSRAPIGYIAIAENEVATNQGCKSVVPNLDVVEIEYVYYTLIALTKDIISRASGTTFLEISGKKMGETLFPLPPLAEQRRIVERLNKLLPSVEAMEKLYQQ